MIAVIDGVVHMVAPPVPGHLGRCYELSGKQVINSGDPGAHLVHGTIQGFGEPPIGHAWVELSDGSVWEPAGATVYPGEVFAALFNPVEHARHSAHEASVKMLVTGHFGPWED